jgi:hypothetical protein
LTKECCKKEFSVQMAIVEGTKLLLLQKQNFNVLDKKKLDNSIKLTQ